MGKLSEKQIVLGGLIGIGVLFSVIAALTDCSAGGADNYAHFNIARWAFRYPHLFLDHWGKPLYTILVAPFDQIGFYGARLFNIIIGLLTAWFCFLLAVRLKMQKTWMVPIFVIFAPMYFVLMFSGMTEILFSLVLILAIFLFFSDRFILSSIVISFLILVRSEGFIFIPIFLLAFSFKKEYLAIPFLISGFLTFSLIGWDYYHNFWWLIDKLPYGGSSSEIYGSGSWYHFLAKMPEFLDYFILIFFLVGTIIWVKDWVTSPQIKSGKFYSLLLLAGCFWVYLAAHSYVWWKGEMSLGLIRVMAGVSPLAGIIALAGWNEVEKLIRLRVVKIVFLAVSVLMIVIPGTLRYRSAFLSDPRTEVIDRAITWLHDTGNFNHHLIVHDPYIAFAAKVDAWDQQRLQYGFSDVNAPEKEMADSSIFIWDAHFSQNEGRIPASQIIGNPYYELIAYFEPDIPFKVLNGYDYNIMVFRKINSPKSDNELILGDLKEKLKQPRIVYTECFDFEKPFPKRIPEKFRKESIDSIANFCFQMGPDCEFSPTVVLTAEQIKITNQLSFAVQFDYKIDEPLFVKEALMVCSVEKDDKPYFYQGEDILPFAKRADKWNHANFNFLMPGQVKKGTEIKFYIWNIHKKRLNIDNFSVQVFAHS